MKKFLPALIIITALFAVAAPRRASAQEPQPKGMYLIQHDDKLDIKVWPFDELSMSVIVRPDGYISYPMLEGGEFKVEGKTVKEVIDKLAADMGKYVKEPKVSVNVTPFKTVDRAFVLGAVKAPGVYDVHEGDNILDLISRAGGPTKESKTSQVALIRPPKKPESQNQAVAPAEMKPPVPGETPEMNMTIVNVAEMIGKGKLPDQSSFFIQDGDIVFVPSGKRIDWQKIYSVILSAYYLLTIPSVSN